MLDTGEILIFAKDLSVSVIPTEYGNHQFSGIQVFHAINHLITSVSFICCMPDHATWKSNQEMTITVP